MHSNTLLRDEDVRCGKTTFTMTCMNMNNQMLVLLLYIMRHAEPGTAVVLLCYLEIRDAERAQVLYQVPGIRVDYTSTCVPELSWLLACLKFKFHFPTRPASSGAISDQGTHRRNTGCLPEAYLIRRKVMVQQSLVLAIPVHQPGRELFDVSDGIVWRSSTSITSNTSSSSNAFSRDRHHGSLEPGRRHCCCGKSPNVMLIARKRSNSREREEQNTHEHVKEECGHSPGGVGHYYTAKRGRGQGTNNAINWVCFRIIEFWDFLAVGGSALFCMNTCAASNHVPLPLTDC